MCVTLAVRLMLTGKDFAITKLSIKPEIFPFLSTVIFAAIQPDAKIICKLILKDYILNTTLKIIFLSMKMVQFGSSKLGTRKLIFKRKNKENSITFTS